MTSRFWPRVIADEEPGKSALIKLLAYDDPGGLPALPRALTDLREHDGAWWESGRMGPARRALSARIRANISTVA